MAQILCKMGGESSSCGSRIQVHLWIWELQTGMHLGVSRPSRYCTLFHHWFPYAKCSITWIKLGFPRSKEKNTYCILLYYQSGHILSKHYNSQIRSENHVMFMCGLLPNSHGIYEASWTWRPSSEVATISTIFPPPATWRTGAGALRLVPQHWWWTDDHWWWTDDDYYYYYHYYYYDDYDYDHDELMMNWWLLITAGHLSICWSFSDWLSATR